MTSTFTLFLLPYSCIFSETKLFQDPGSVILCHSYKTALDLRMAGAMFTLREFKEEARRSREMLDLQVRFLFLDFMISNPLLQVKEAKALLAIQTRQDRVLLEEVPYHHGHHQDHTFLCNCYRCPSCRCHHCVLLQERQNSSLSEKLEDESSDDSSCSSSSSSSSSSEDSSDEEDEDGSEFALKNIVSQVFGDRPSFYDSPSKSKKDDLQGTGVDSISMEADLRDDEEEVKIEKYREISAAKEFFPSSNSIDSYEEECGERVEEMLDMSDLSETMLADLGMVESTLGGNIFRQSAILDNSTLMEESKMFNYMVGEGGQRSSLPDNWLDTGDVVVSSAVDDVMVYGFQADSPQSSIFATFGSEATKSELMDTEITDLENLLNSEVIAPRGMSYISGDTNLDVPQPELANPIAQVLKPEFVQAQPKSAPLSANESKCPQCGRLFKNASALHNHTRKGTKCKSALEPSQPKSNVLKGFDMNSQKVKPSSQLNLPKWVKNTSNPNFEGDGGDQAAALKDSKVSKAPFSQMWKQAESEELKCGECPGMMFKNDTSFKVHMRGHRSREKVPAAERWPQNILPGISSTQASVETSPQQTSELITNPKSSSTAQSEKNAFSSPSSSFNEAGVQPLKSKMTNGRLSCLENECSQMFPTATQRNCHSRQHKVAGMRRPTPASNRNFG